MGSVFSDVDRKFIAKAGVKKTRFFLLKINFIPIRWFNAQHMNKSVILHIYARSTGALYRNGSLEGVHMMFLNKSGRIYIL